MKEDALNELFYEIQDVRKEMMHIANIYGYTHEKTIDVSQRLDDIMNEYHQKMTEPTDTSSRYTNFTRKYGKAIKQAFQLQILHVIFIFTNYATSMEW